MPSFDVWIDDRARQVVVQFQFDPNAIVLKAGGTLILDGYRVGLLLIILLLFLRVMFNDTMSWLR